MKVPKHVAKRIDASAEGWRNISPTRLERLKRKHGPNIRPNILGWYGPDPNTAGGVSKCKHVETVVNLNLRVKMLAIHNFCDMGCGAGNPGMAVKATYPRCNCVNIDCDPVRVGIGEEREKKLALDRVKSSRWIVTNWLNNWQDRNVWGFLSEKKYVIYFMNAIMVGDVTNILEEVVVRYCKPGSAVISYLPMFTGDRRRLVDSEEHTILVDSSHFSWIGGPGNLKVYIYILNENEVVGG